MANAKRRRKRKGTDAAPLAIPMNERKGPFLSAALIAEKVLTEQDMTMTFVRVVDRCNIPPEAVVNLEDKLLTLPFLVIVVTFKACGYKGDSDLQIVQGGRSVDTQSLGMSMIPFDGTQGRSYTVCCPVGLKWEGDGFYWFEIRLNNEFITRIPLEVNATNASLT